VYRSGSTGQCKATVRCRAGRRQWVSGTNFRQLRTEDSQDQAGEPWHRHLDTDERLQAQQPVSTIRVEPPTCRTAGSCRTSYYSYYLIAADPLDPHDDKMTASRDGRSSSATDTTYATGYTYTANGRLATVTTPATSDFPVAVPRPIPLRPGPRRETAAAPHCLVRLPPTSRQARR
jgi:hypothetical protein